MDYIKQLEKSTLIQQASTETGLILDTLVHQEQLYRKKKSNYKGMRKMSELILNDMEEFGNVYLKVLGYCLKNVNKNNELVNKNGKPITITEIANHLNISRENASNAVSQMVKRGRVKKNKRLITVSPYLYVPYNTSDDKLFILQTYWDSDFTYNIRTELEEANKATEAYIRNNTPKESNKS